MLRMSSEAADVALVFDAPGVPAKPAPWAHGTQWGTMIRYSVELATTDENRLTHLARYKNRICAIEFAANGFTKQVGTAHQFRQERKDGKLVLACTVEVDKAMWDLLFQEIREGAAFYVDDLFVVGPLG
jgi:hypothetical protein